MSKQRVIRFRVWRDSFSIQNDHYEGSWLPNRYIGSDGKVYLDDYGLCSEHYVEDYGGRLHVEWFTGLTDKNGREIYEGDIIRSESYDYLPVAVVVYVDYKARFAPCEIDEYQNSKRDGDLFNEPGYPWLLCYCQVIGNIHENPELLNPS